jgi:hypothetical protein
VVGPSTAKLQFIRYAAKKDRTLEPRIVGVETVDHPTDRQLGAYRVTPVRRVGGCRRRAPRVSPEADGGFYDVAFGRRPDSAGEYDFSVGNHDSHVLALEGRMGRERVLDGLPQRVRRHRGKRLFDEEAFDLPHAHEIAHATNGVLVLGVGLDGALQGDDTAGDG